MKTDLERFVKLYKSFGIDCVVDHTMLFSEIKFIADSLYDKEGTCSDKFEGYVGFYSKVRFDADGKFIKQGFWE